MAVIDIPHRTITLKIVYYGCARGGKTTNLELLQRMTDPANTQGMVSIATKNDRTLFFDLLPMTLGQVGGLQVKVKLYTVPGQLHYEVTRRQILAGADGVVLVVDSLPSEKKANQWALDNMRMNLRSSGLEPDEVPLVFQWNKRDLPDARPVEDLEADLNGSHRSSVEAVAISGSGVVDTFAAIMKSTIHSVYHKTGRAEISETVIDQTVDRALATAKQAQPRIESAGAHQFDQRFDMDAYQDAQAEQGHARQIVDQDSLLAESVKANMALAERLDGYGHVRDTGERRKDMMLALGWLAPRLADPEQAGLPEGALARLLSGAGRRMGSVLLFKNQQETMDEHAVLPAGSDLLNGVVATGLGSVAYRMSRENDPRLIDDLSIEVFLGNPPPEAMEVGSALVAPMICDGARFGSLVVYSQLTEPPVDEAEVEFWTTASQLTGLALHWRALRRKVLELRAS